MNIIFEKEETASVGRKDRAGLRLKIGDKSKAE